jgi:hypothetical protein
MQLHELLSLILQENNIEVYVQKHQHLYFELTNEHGGRMIFAIGEFAGQLCIADIGKPGEFPRSLMDSPDRILNVELADPDSIPRIVNHLKKWCEDGT